MKTTLPVALLAVFVLSGCGDATDVNGKGAQHTAYKPSIAKPMPFIFPGGKSTTGTETAPRRGGEGGSLKPMPYKHPNVWGIYLASSNYTDGTTDRNLRHGVDQYHLHTLSSFVRENGLHDQVKVIWLQYDDVPVGINYLSKEEGAWDFMPTALRWTNTDSFFDYYVISPASRYGENGRLRYDKWLKPLLSYRSGRDGNIARTFDEESGVNDYKSKFWDKWNRHFFLVNPDGILVDAWVSLGSHSLQTFPDQPINALTHHLKLDPSKLTYPRVNRQGTYISEYKPPIEQQLLDAVNDMSGKLNAQ